MKITTNPHLVQSNMQANKIDKKTNLDQLKSNSIAGGSADSVSVRQSSSELYNIETLQKKYSDSQRMFGALTQLTEALKMFQEKPNVYRENVEKVIQNIQNNFPQIEKELSLADQTPEQVHTNVAKMTARVAEVAKIQKKEIAQYLVREQNRDAVAKRSVNPEQVQKISNQVKEVSANSLHKMNMQKINNILQ